MKPGGKKCFDITLLFFNGQTSLQMLSDVDQNCMSRTV